MIIDNFKLRKTGFTLLELLLIIFLIGILLTVAIANYINFQKRAKTSEAKTNLGGIRTCQEAYHLTKESYLDCPSHPSTIPQGTAVLWRDTQVPEEWEKLGFEPHGRIRYSYKVETSNGGQSFIATAKGDLDSDGTCSIFSITEKGGNIQEDSPLE